ncbi:MAG TPA: hypothetical protein VJC06_01175 [Candidatus Paceibacterota bacterium]
MRNRIIGLLIAIITGLVILADYQGRRADKLQAQLDQRTPKEVGTIYTDISATPFRRVMYVNEKGGSMDLACAQVFDSNGASWIGEYDRLTGPHKIAKISGRVYPPASVWGR